ncbi:MAG: CNNM domain-containing protein [Phycisphaerales bacterium JB043]
MTGLEVWIIVALVGVLLSALMSGTETGVYCVNRVKLKVRSHRRGATRLRRLESEIDSTTRVVASLLIGNNIANYLGSLGIAAILASMALTDAQAIALNALVLTPVLFVFGETIPKEIFRSNADRLMPRLAPVLILLRWVLTITLILPLVLMVVSVLGRAFGVSHVGLRSTARERLATLLHEGARYGALSESQTTLVDRVLALRGTKVRDEMTPWYRVRTLHVDWHPQRVRRQIRRYLYTQYPVVNDQGRVVGVLDAADVWRDGFRTPRDSMHEPPRCRPFESIRDILLALHGSNADMAIVEIENKPVGIVSEKDLIEPITGDLQAF